MKNDNSFITRQQYRQLKKPRRSIFKRRSQPKGRLNEPQDSSFKEFRIKQLSKRLNKIIAVVILLIIIVYLILIFVNF